MQPITVETLLHSQPFTPLWGGNEECIEEQWPVDDFVACLEELKTGFTQVQGLLEADKREAAKETLSVVGTQTVLLLEALRRLGKTCPAHEQARRLAN